MKFRLTRYRTQKGMHSADIVAAVKKCGTSLRQLGLRNGFAASTLRSALHKPHPRAQQLIAQTIGRSVHEIWPQWFDASGARISPKPLSRSRKNPLTTRVQESNPAASPSPSKSAA